MNFRLALCQLVISSVIALIGPPAHSGTPNSQHHSAPSSYAPRKQHSRHVYGSPIGRPAVTRSHHYPSHTTRRANGVVRDAHGRIKRSTRAKDAFRRSHPCPSTGKTHGACPGYVIDHVRALKHGGADEPGNMQWQTREAAKEKDRVE
jgi:hypothetical protein